GARQKSRYVRNGPETGLKVRALASVAMGQKRHCLFRAVPHGVSMSGKQSTDGRSTAFQNVAENWEDTVKLPRRKFLHVAAGAAALPALSRIALAQAYPTRPVRLISGFAAGGSNDLRARLIGQWLSERLGQPFVIENRPGAGGIIA